MKTALKQKLAAALLAAAALLSPAAQIQAQPLAAEPAIRKITDEKSYEPGGENHLFGGARGHVEKRKGSIGITSSSSVILGNIRLEHIRFGGKYGYETHFHNHPWQVHDPFDHSAAREGGGKGSALADGYGAVNYVYSIRGKMVHPANGYDGRQGGGYPAPKGARDIYSYSVSGGASRSTLIEPEQAPCPAGLCRPDAQSGMQPQKRWEKPESTPRGNAPSDNGGSAADEAAAARGVAQAEKLFRNYDVGGIRLGFSRTDLIRMGYGMPPEALAVSKDASLTRKLPDAYATPLAQGMERLGAYEQDHAMRYGESIRREMAVIDRPFDSAVNWKTGAADKTAAGLRMVNNTFTYVGNAFGFNTIAEAAIPDAASAAVGREIAKAKDKANDWAGSDPEKRAYAALGIAGAETLANVLPSRLGKGRAARAGKGGKTHGGDTHIGPGSHHGDAHTGKPHQNHSGDAHGGSSPHAHHDGNSSASGHYSRADSHASYLPERKPDIPYARAGNHSRNGGHTARPERPSTNSGSRTDGGKTNPPDSRDKGDGGGPGGDDGNGNGGGGGGDKGSSGDDAPPPPDNPDGAFPQGIAFNPNLKHHLSDVDGLDRNGIKGGHNQDNFMKELERLAALDPHGKMTVEDMIVRREPTATDGITRIYYKIPTFDGRNAHANGGKGNVSGYKEASSPKTVYDPAKYSDKEMLDMAQQAAAKGYEEAMKKDLKEITAEVNGITFRIYMERNKGKNNDIIQNIGVVKNVFPSSE